ncbi:MAG TPA: hypothetical protein VMS55_14755 [Myxococcota bacterium]|nr:hypothetical protein [Myxococcota bacterium]
MSQNSNRVALRIGAACLLAVIALLVARAHQAGEPKTEGAAAEASQCGGGSSPEAMSAALEDAKEQARQQQGASGADDSGWVVLNNRGYNYGTGPDVAFDMRLFEHEQRPATQD